MGVLAIIDIVFKILTGIPALIVAAESVYGAAKGKGEVKKSLVLQGAAAALDVVAATGNDDAAKPEVRDAILGVVDKTIDATVAIFNVTSSWPGLPAGTDVR